MTTEIAVKISSQRVAHAIEMALIARLSDESRIKWIRETHVYAWMTGLVADGEEAVAVQTLVLRLISFTAYIAESLEEVPVLLREIISSLMLTGNEREDVIDVLGDLGEDISYLYDDKEDFCQDDDDDEEGCDDE